MKSDYDVRLYLIGITQITLHYFNFGQVIVICLYTLSEMASETTGRSLSFAATHQVNTSKTHYRRHTVDLHRPTIEGA